VDALLGADALLFAFSLYDHGVSQYFKTWVDLVLTDLWLAPGIEPVIAGKPAVLVTVRGGWVRAGNGRARRDHPTPWMRRILADLWRLDLRVTEAESTPADRNLAIPVALAHHSCARHKDARMLRQDLANRRASAA
jgi:FMN-dependent NADH-azoreductase